MNQSREDKVVNILGIYGGLLLAAIAVLRKPQEFIRPIGAWIGNVGVEILAFFLAALQLVAAWPIYTIWRLMAQKVAWNTVTYLARRGWLFEARVVAVIATKIFGGLMYRAYARNWYLNEGLYRVLIKESGFVVKQVPGRRYFYQTHAWAKKKEDGRYAILLFVHHNKD